MFKTQTLKRLLSLTLPSFPVALVSHVALAGSLNLVPTKNVQALTPENFCVGMGNVLKTIKQTITDEAALLCPNGVPSATLKALVATPYTGAGTPNMVTLASTEFKDTTSSLITVAYSMKVPKNAVKALLGEEKHVNAVYKGDNLSISAKFLPPPINTGEADTAFQLEQRTTVVDKVSFDEASVHDLRLYRMFPNNFDMMMAVRTLNKPSEQFRKAVVIRGVMNDPNDPNQALSFSLLSFLMNSRNQHDRVIAAFSKFIEVDFMTLYSEQTKP